MNNEKPNFIIDKKKIQKDCVNSIKNDLWLSTRYMYESFKVNQITHRKFKELLYYKNK